MREIENCESGEKKRNQKRERDKYQKLEKHKTLKNTKKKLDKILENKNY